MSPLSLLLLAVAGVDADTILRDGFEPVQPAIAAACDDPLVMPEGFTVQTHSWSQLFTPPDGSPVPEFPLSNGFPVPVGANLWHIRAASFVAPAGMVGTLFWEGAQANPSQGYFYARPAEAMFVGISACPGDLRVGEGYDPCARFSSTGSLVFNTVLAGPHPTSCTLEAGKTYWLNVSPHDPATLQPACRPVPTSAEGCDVQARQTSP